MTFAPGRVVSAAAGLGACVALGCAAPAIPEITIDAADHSFAMPDTVVGGLVRIRFVNTGQEDHHAQLVRLKDGVTPEQYATTFWAVMKAVATEGDAAYLRLFDVASVAGGPSAIGPGKQLEIVTDLAPGRYRVYCFVPGPDGVPHMMKGMARELTVTARAPRQPPPPVADATIDMADFAFTVPELKAGTHVLRVTNSGKEPHETAIVRLKGITAARLLEMFTTPPASGSPAPPGPPPFEFVGGFQAIMPGQVGWLTLDLTPADYVALCFVPSPANQGKPHLALGMVKAFTVR